MSFVYLDHIPFIEIGQKLDYSAYYMMDYGIIYFNGHLHIDDTKMKVFVGWFDTTTELIEFYENWKRSL